MFHWIEVRALCHATEEEERVVAALRTVFPEADPRRDAVEGHFGNPIVVLTYRTKDAHEHRAGWTRIVHSLGKEALLRDIAERLDEDGIYHLRIDKQKAYQGRIEAATSSDVLAFRAKVAAFPRKRAIAMDTLLKVTEAT